MSLDELAAAARTPVLARGGVSAAAGDTAEPSAAAGRRAGAARWGLTLLATGASSWTLDAFATAFGVLTAASGLFDGLSHGSVLALLGGSYLCWAAGLRVNLIANARLLEDTGTSTNALSKIAFDVVRVRSGGRRARQAAATAGYLGTEIVMEVPYYAGAFGAAALSDSVHASHALVFMAGTNIAAGLYEYGLARLTRALLARRDRRRTPDEAGPAT